MTKYPIAHHVFKNNTHIGTLVGAIHCHFNPIETEFLKQKLKSLLGDSTHVLTEIPLNWMGGLGVESALKDVLAQHDPISAESFETLAAQSAMLKNRFFLGDRLFSFGLPYSWFMKAPRMMAFLLSLAAFFFRTYNTLFNLFTMGRHSAYVAQVIESNPAVLLEMHKQYRTNAIEDLMSGDDRRYLCMLERDSLYAQRLMQITGKWLAVVGVFHLTGDKNVAQLLEDQGYELQAFDVFDGTH